MFYHFGLCDLSDKEQAGGDSELEFIVCAKIIVHVLFRCYQFKG